MLWGEGDGTMAGGAEDLAALHRKPTSGRAAVVKEATPKDLFSRTSDMLSTLISLFVFLGCVVVLPFYTFTKILCVTCSGASKSKGD